MDSIKAFAASAHTSAPRNLGQRYTHERFLPQAGNTVVCHLDTTSPDHHAVLEARARLKARPGAERFIFTPANSLHMTLFEGVIEGRRTADAWPAGMDRDAPIDSVTNALLPRLKGFSAPPRFAVRADAVLPFGLALSGATPQDDATMREWRDALTKPFGYRQEVHDSYRFHMTFAYPLDWIPDAQIADWEMGLSEILAELQASAPVIPLKTPAFCSFADMTHFKELCGLSG